MLEQIFGNISQRKMFKDQKQDASSGIPGCNALIAGAAFCHRRPIRR